MYHQFGEDESNFKNLSNILDIPTSVSIFHAKKLITHYYYEMWRSRALMKIDSRDVYA